MTEVRAVGFFDGRGQEIARVSTHPVNIMAGDKLEFTVDLTFDAEPMRTLADLPRLDCLDAPRPDPAR